MMTSNPSAIRDAYDNVYASLAGPFGGDERYRWIAARYFAPLTAPQSILEIGCGEGTLLAYLASRGHWVAGIDVSASGVAKATAKGIACHQLDISTQPLPFPDRAFGWVVCLETIEHLENPHRCLQEIGRVLVDGGALLISIPNSRIGHPYCYPGLFERAPFMRFLELHGFHVMSVEGWGQGQTMNNLQRRLEGLAWMRRLGMTAALKYFVRKRNLLMRKTRTPLRYAHCWNFLCRYRADHPDPLTHIATIMHAGDPSSPDRSMNR